MELRNVVEKFGGIYKVTQKKMFKAVSRKMRLPSTITNSSTSLRKHYTRYILPIEKLLGEKQQEQDKPVIALALAEESQPGTASAVLGWVLDSSGEGEGHRSAFNQVRRIDAMEMGE